MRLTYALLRNVCLSCLPCLASMSGIVTDLSGHGLPGVEVSRALDGSSTTTNSSGRWTLGATTRIEARSVTTSPARWLGGSVEIFLAAPSIVAIEAFDLAGAYQGGLTSTSLEAGLHRLPLRLAGSRVLRLRTSVTLRASHTTGPSGSGDVSARAGRSQSEPDTLRFTWQSKAQVTIPLAVRDTDGILLRLDTASGGTWNQNISYGALYDGRDGQVYRTVKIGTQTWMAENLNFRTARLDSGEVLQPVHPDSSKKYGRTYGWVTAMDLDTSCFNAFCRTLVHSIHRGICPTGWHVPHDVEWSQLANFVDTGFMSGTKLRSQAGWFKPWGNGTDLHGFRALPTGSGFSNGFVTKGDSAGADGFRQFARWWTSKEGYDATRALARTMEYNTTNLSYVQAWKLMAFAVRCVKD